LIAASSRQHFARDTPTAVLVRQVLGAIAEFDKSMLVTKLAAAHTRKRKATVLKVKGRKSLAETRPEVVALAKALMRKKLKVGQMSLRAISAELAGLGHVNERGSPFNQGSIAAMSGQERGMASTINLTGNELAAVPAAIRGVVEADRHPLWRALIRCVLCWRGSGRLRRAKVSTVSDTSPAKGEKRTRRT
jgi:hypothetical protein